MSDNGKSIRAEGYWSALNESRKSIVSMIESVEGRDGWTIHAVVASGDSKDAVYAVVIRSMVGESGLLLSERMVRIPHDISSSEELGMLDNGIHRRISGPLAQALVRGYARADNDRFAADDNPDPLALDAIGEQVDDAPDWMVEEETPHEDFRPSGSTHECAACGESVSERSGINIGDALGIDKWVHESCEGEQ
jgi:hypothetical protein